LNLWVDDGRREFTRSVILLIDREDSLRVGHGLDCLFIIWSVLELVLIFILPLCRAPGFASKISEGPVPLGFPLLAKYLIK